MFFGQGPGWNSSGAGSILSGLVPLPHTIDQTCNPPLVMAPQGVAR